MKNINRYALGMALALGLVLAAAGFAQTITQGDQKKTTESCCAMACCSHDSASMKDAKEHSKHEGCCAGDSCNMKVKEGAKSQMNHSAMAGWCGCCGDSCDMKMKKDGAKSQMDHSTMAGCCGCCGDSCDMKMKKDGAKSQMDHSTMAGCCGCCGDSCEKEMKHKEKTN